MNQIASCIFNFLKSIPVGVEDIIFYSYTCGGGDKNNFVALMFLYALHNSNLLPDSVKTITHKFMVTGHLHMECDRNRALFERD